uniref:Uncharacterized protein n=1 Tax=Cacopsylla melanoneura TaxID=428564 RepID=A0A8D8Z3Y4_9HEMI
MVGDVGIICRLYEGFGECLCPYFTRGSSFCNEYNYLFLSCSSSYIYVTYIISSSKNSFVVVATSMWSLHKKGNWSSVNISKNCRSCDYVWLGARSSHVHMFLCPL